MINVAYTQYFEIDAVPIPGFPDLVMVYWRESDEELPNRIITLASDFEKTFNGVTEIENHPEDMLYRATKDVRNGPNEIMNESAVLYPFLLTPEGYDKLVNGDMNFWDDPKHQFKPSEIGEEIPEDTVLIWFNFETYYWELGDGTVRQRYLKFSEYWSFGWDVQGMAEFVQRHPDIKLVSLEEIMGGDRDVEFKIPVTPEQYVRSFADDSVKKELYQKYGLDEFKTP